MNVLREKCFSKEWLDEQRQEMGRVDPGLFEKSIHALELVGLLAAKELPFSFKGGTCMLLLLENIRRLSIDVDCLYHARRRTGIRSRGYRVRKSVPKL